MNDSLNVSIDWTKNWNGSIAVKVTAVILWSILILSFVITIPWMSNFEQNQIKDYLWQAHQVRGSVEPFIVTDSDYDELEAHLNDINYIDTQHLLITFQDEETVEWGTDSPELYRINIHHVAEATGEHYSITYGFTPLETAIRWERAKVGSLILAVSVVLSLFIYWLTRNIVHTPFSQLLSFIQSISENDRSRRITNTREDEFGILAQFLNDMLSKLEKNSDELNKANLHLKEEIKNRDDALLANKLKSSFLANMSHEIRTPLTSILGYTERLRYSTSLNENERNNILDTVLKNSNHLLRIINDILDLSKIEANKIEIQKSQFSVTQVMDDVRLLMSDKASERNNQLEIDFIYPIPEKIYSDPTRLKQILINLCGNAIRFTENGQITLTVSFNQPSDLLIIDVRDTGIGMTEEEIGNIFQPFTQASRSIEHDFGGTGLGLTITQRLTELLGGQLDVKSIKQVGSHFHLALTAGYDGEAPMLEESTVYDVTTTNQTDTNSEVELSGHILLVEDTRDIQALVKIYLEDSGLTVEVANNGEEGVEKALAGQFDLILMDIQMPVMDGQAAIKLLRENGLEIPIIALTANALTKDVIHYADIGFNDTIIKPIDTRLLFEKLSQYLKHKDRRQPSPALLDKLHKIRESFIKDLPQQLAALDTALVTKNINDGLFQAHRLKGLGAQFGLDEMSVQTSIIENALSNNDPDTAQQHFTLLKIYCEKLMHYSSND